MSKLRSFGYAAVIFAALNGCATESLDDGTSGTTPAASGAAYAVTISQQPAGQACTLAGDTGTVGAAAVSSVLVNCTPNTYAVGGSVTGLVGTLVVQNEGGDDLTLTADGTFAFATPI